MNNARAVVGSWLAFSLDNDIIPESRKELIHSLGFDVFGLGFRCGLCKPHTFLIL